MHASSRRATHTKFTAHKRGPRQMSTQELTNFKITKNLMAQQSDDEGSTVDARVYSVPPVWVTMVDDMNRDISQIKIKRARMPPKHCPRAHDTHSKCVCVCACVCLCVPLLLPCTPALATSAARLAPDRIAAWRIPRTGHARACAVSELQDMSGKALLPGFNDDDDQEEIIVSTVAEISQYFKDCERRLKEMSRTKSEGSGDEVRRHPRAECPMPRMSALPEAFLVRLALLPLLLLRRRRRRRRRLRLLLPPPSPPLPRALALPLSPALCLPHICAACLTAVRAANVCSACRVCR